MRIKVWMSWGREEMGLCESQGGKRVISLPLVYLRCLRLTEARGGQKVLVERVSGARKTEPLIATAPSYVSDSQMTS